ncbi:hypothetical protein CCICO_01890 [Corynebacterium ciconiae DSM 44920]|uniref:hypothetical protein n=1 Tax=Corynebacterium ciconiae TaxID=227319 RepID=UPI000370C996|nr:hypothetical protein [Corynebacterium ciconiae]WKD60430.1 hypothetical protein CCICO_01890 [Corynebacterium ciconiae DSM 44920]
MTTLNRRVDGLDIARAIAIVGMMYAHTVFNGPAVFRELTDGYPSTLFAVLSGISLAIVLDRYNATVAMIRGIVLIAVSIPLSAFSGDIAVVLGTIGVAQILLAPIARWRTRRIVILVTVLVLAGPLIDAALTRSASPFGMVGFGVYPLPAWLAYTLIGVVLARIYWSRGVLWCIPAGVLALVVRGVVLAHVGTRPGPVEMMVDPSFGGSPLSYIVPTPHSGAIGDVVCTGLVAAGIIVALRRAHFYPLQAMGSMAFSVYVVHVLLAAPMVDAAGLSKNASEATSSAWTSYFSPSEERSEPMNMTDAPSPTSDTSRGAADSAAEGALEQHRRTAMEVLQTRLRAASTAEEVEQAIYDYSTDYLLADPEETGMLATPMTPEQQQLRDQLLELSSADEANTVVDDYIQRQSSGTDSEDIYQPTSGGESYSWTDFSVFAIQAIASVLLTPLYRLRWRRGPLEYVLHRLSVSGGASDRAANNAPAHYPHWVLAPAPNRQAQAAVASATATK